MDDKTFVPISKGVGVVLGPTRLLTARELMSMARRPKLRDRFIGHVEEAAAYINPYVSNHGEVEKLGFPDDVGVMLETIENSIRALERARRFLISADEADLTDVNSPPSAGESS
jgi:hypothetical protein